MVLAGVAPGHDVVAVAVGSGGRAGGRGETGRDHGFRAAGSHGDGEDVGLGSAVGAEARTAQGVALGVAQRVLDDDLVLAVQQGHQAGGGAVAVEDHDRLVLVVRREIGRQAVLAGHNAALVQTVVDLADAAGECDAVHQQLVIVDIRHRVGAAVVEHVLIEGHDHRLDRRVDLQRAGDVRGAGQFDAGQDRPGIVDRVGIARDVDAVVAADAVAGPIDDVAAVGRHGHAGESLVAGQRRIDRRFRGDCLVLLAQALAVEGADEHALGIDIRANVLRIERIGRCAGAVPGDDIVPVRVHRDRGVHLVAGERRRLRHRPGRIGGCALAVMVKLA